MKKNLKFLSMLLFATIACFAFTSCSSDDDEGASFEVPAYEAVSAKYIANDSRAEINSLELTASGNYIIVKNQNVYSAPERKTLSQNMFMCNSFVTRATQYDNIIYGKFTQLDENKYNLEGYGVVTITAISNDVYDLDITLDNGNVINVGARKQNTYEDSEATNKLCRTWNIEKMGIKFEAGEPGHMYRYEKMVNADEIDVLYTDFIKWVLRMSGEDTELTQSEIDEMVAEFAEQWNAVRPLSMVFTKSGSYMVEYVNSAIGISTWNWENENKGILRYSWNVEDLYDEYIGGEVEISYSGNMLLIDEAVIDEPADEDGYVEKFVLIWGLVEEK